MVIFHSYVSLPEGIRIHTIWGISDVDFAAEHIGTMAIRMIYGYLRAISRYKANHDQCFVLKYTTENLI